MGVRDLPDMYALGPAALRLQAYISGKSVVPMLQLLHHPCDMLDIPQQNPLKYGLSGIER